jgi:hypothetical protein
MAKAKAPRPGTTSPEGERVIKITVNGEAAIIRPGEFGPRDDALVRRETKAALGEKRSLMGAFASLDEETIGLDSICLLWWLARRKAGDTTESFAEALDRFPSYGEATEAIEMAEVVDDGEDDSGEA